MLLQDLLGVVVEQLVDVAAGPCCCLADWRRCQSLLAFPQALPELEGDSEVVEGVDRSRRPLPAVPSRL